MTDFAAWVGRSEERRDRLDPARSNALLAAIGHASDLNVGDDLPELHHWLHFWDPRTPEQTGTDGHPQKGGFLPPIPLPRRMWAGGRLIFRTPLVLGEDVRRVSTILSIEEKSGRSGTLMFVTVGHQLFMGDRLAIEEEQDLVYREPAAVDASNPPAAVAWEEEGALAVVDPDEVLLFRYSALTLNGHRIHYDYPYATGEEHYEGLVVQGPLQATLLAGAAVDRLNGPLATFRFRGIAPAIAGHRLTLHAVDTDEGVSLWTAQRGVRTMSAVAVRA